MRTNTKRVQLASLQHNGALSIKPAFNFLSDRPPWCCWISQYLWGIFPRKKVVCHWLAAVKYNSQTTYSNYCQVLIVMSSIYIVHFNFLKSSHTTFATIPSNKSVSYLYLMLLFYLFIIGVSYFSAKICFNYCKPLWKLFTKMQYIVGKSEHAEGVAGELGGCILKMPTHRSSPSVYICNITWG